MQSRHYIKLYNKTYIDKMLERHHWLKEDNFNMPTHPTPMYHDNSYLCSLETTTIPTDKVIKSLEREIGFGYHQAIGELIYALVTYRPYSIHETCSILHKTPTNPFRSNKASLSLPTSN